MYIRKTKTRSINNTNHFTYRLVESRRDPAGKVKQHTLLNLGAHYSIIEESDLPLLSQRIENIISGQQSLLPLTDNLETEAQRIANLVIKKHAKPLIYDDKNDQVQYREVDIGTIENSDNKQPRRKQRGIFRTLSLYTYAASSGEYTQKRLKR